MAGAVIGALRVTLGADTGSFEDGMKKASGSLKDFAANATTIAAGINLAKIFEKIGEAIGDMVKGTFRAIDAMDKMGKEAQKLGIGVEKLSELSVAAKLSDISVEELGKSIVQLSKRMVEGKESATDPASRALTSLGISAKTTTGQFKTGDQILAEVADKFQNLRDGVEKTTVATMLFGRAGAAMIPLLNEGREGLGKAAEMAAKLNLVMGKESADSAQRFNDNLKLVSLGLTQGIFNAIAERVLPALESFSASMLRLTVSFLSFIGASKTGEAVLKAVEDARKRLNVVTEEAARREEQLKEKILSTALQTRISRGDFAALGEGFIEAGASMKLFGDNLSMFPTKLDQLTESQKRLVVEMRAWREQQAILELLPPWDLFIEKMRVLEIGVRAGTVSFAEFEAKSLQAANNMRNAYAMAASGVANSFGEMFTAIGGQQQSWAQAAKIAAAAAALINTFQGATLALAQGGIFGFASAAAIIAKGLTLVAAIKGTSLGFAHGGSFEVPGPGGMDSRMVNFMATPGERVTVDTPGQQQKSGGNAVLNVSGIRSGDYFRGDVVRDIINGIVEWQRDSGGRVLFDPSRA